MHRQSDSEQPNPFLIQTYPHYPHRLNPSQTTFFAALRHFTIALFGALVLTCSASPANAQQFRAVWADVFHDGTASPTQVTNMINALVAGRYNVLVLQVLGYMDTNNTASHGAHWQSSILPWSTNVTHTFDPLSSVCVLAHANGIQVHAWLGGSGGGPYRVSTSWPPKGSILTNHPQWFMVPYANSEGNAVATVDGNYNLDMGSPDAQEFIVSIVRELVTNYPIDGINWDDEINSNTMGWGYPAYSLSTNSHSGLARYRTNYNYTGSTPVYNDPAWAECLRRYKGELMARVQAEIQSIRTNPRQPLWHTTAPLAYGSVPSDGNFSNTTAYAYYCDWAGMLRNGWVDAAIPQFYSSSTCYTWCDRSYSYWQYNRKIFPGFGAYNHTKAETLNELKYAYNAGLNGTSIYSYAVPCNDGGDWWSYIATNLYTNTATVPTMWWRDPNTATNGIIWGQVTDGATGLVVDYATVTVASGPTVKTDGNGYYVATLVPATSSGTSHSTTVTKTGMTPQTVNAIAFAGDIVRYDLTLNASSGAVITGQPQSTSVSQGADATFRVTANGSGTLHYQWQFFSTNLDGATASAYTRSNAQPAHEGDYRVVVTNSINAVTSDAAHLTVVVPPHITTPPLSQTVTQNLNVTFTVVATGSTPLSYQWEFNNGIISGATGTTYTRINVQPGDAGTYTIVVTNSAGTDTASAILTVSEVPTPPGISAQPVSQTIVAGQSATFSVTGTGSLPLSYQWWFNGETITGATTNTYTRPNIQLPDAGTYGVVITNLYGAFTSSPAALTVNYSLTATATTGGIVTKSPNQTSYAPNSIVTLTATTNTGCAFIGWSGDACGTNNPLSVTLTTNLSVTANFIVTTNEIVVDNTDSGWSNTSPSGSWSSGSTAGVPKIGTDYLYTAGSGSISSTTRSCRWTPTIPAPGYFDVWVYYQLGANRNPGVTYKTYYNGGNVSSLQNQYSSTPNQGGWFQVGTNLPFAAGTTGYVELGNNSTSTTLVSADAARFNLVTPIAPPLVTSQPQSQAISAGQNATFSVAASGTAPLRYQWRFNGTALGNATGVSYTRQNPQPGDAGPYTVVVTNSVGSVTSWTAMLTINTGPTIGGQPLSCTNAYGTDAAFSVSASGTAPLSYEWRFNAAPIADATHSAYTRTAVHSWDAGSYCVVITNIAGRATSDTATLAVLAPAAPHIDSISLVAGGQIRLQVSGSPGQYGIDGSSNLTIWQELTNFTTTTTSFDYTDSPTNLNYRLYRARLVW